MIIVMVRGKLSNVGLWKLGVEETQKSRKKTIKNTTAVTSLPQTAETVLPVNELTVQKTKEDENIRKYSLT